MKFKEMLKLLGQDGWDEKSQKGSHRQLMHPSRPGRSPYQHTGRYTERRPEFNF